MGWRIRDQPAVCQRKAVGVGGHGCQKRRRCAGTAGERPSGVLTDDSGAIDDVARVGVGVQCHVGQLATVTGVLATRSLRGVAGLDHSATRLPARHRKQLETPPPPPPPLAVAGEPHEDSSPVATSSVVPPTAVTYGSDAGYHTCEEVLREDTGRTAVAGCCITPTDRPRRRVGRSSRTQPRRPRRWSIRALPADRDLTGVCRWGGRRRSGRSHPRTMTSMDRRRSCRCGRGQARSRPATSSSRSTSPAPDRAVVPPATGTSVIGTVVP